MAPKPLWIFRLQRICTGIDRLNAFTGKAVSWLSTLMVLAVTIDVILRYFFNISFVALQEIEWHMFALLFLLGSGCTLMRNGHVRVDVIYQRLSRRQKAFINLFGCLFFLLPGCYLVIKTSIPFVLNSWSIMESSPDPGGLPARYILKAVIPASFLLVAIQGISMFFRNLFIFMGVDKDRRS